MIAVDSDSLSYKSRAPAKAYGCAAVNVTAKLANARSKEDSEAESKYDALKPVELGDREYLAKRDAAKQSSSGSVT